MPSPLNPGDVVAERYRIEHVLGEGGMGVVLAAQHLGLGERVALKLLLPEAARVPGVVERFQREARSAMRIQSEHVARVMDVGMLDNGTSYLVMEYLEGRDLGQELEVSGRLPIETAVDYVLQGAIGVSEAHALGIVHRDLKPSNLFLAKLPSGRSLIKVLDFGIAKEVQDADGKKLTSTFSALGSAAYMSPEQVRMAKSVDARTDVWAFGVVLYELLTTEIPFDGGSLPALSAAIIADPPRPIRALRPDVPPALGDVIHACLEKDRERRTPTLAALAHALAPFGGPYARVYVARIVQALGDAPSVPSATIASTSSAAVTRVEQTSGPSWSKTQAGAGSGRSRTARVAVLVGASAAALFVVVAVIAGLSKRTSDEGRASAAESTEKPFTPQSSEPSVAALQSTAPSVARDGGPTAAVSALPAASTPEPPSRLERGSAKRGSTKSGGSATTRKKPMVKDL